MTSPEQIFIHPAAAPFIRALSLTEPEQLLFPFTTIFVVGALFSGFMRLVLLWIQTRIGHAIGADFSMSIYRKTLYQPYSVHVGRNSSEVITGVSTKATYVVHNTIMPILTICSAAVMALFVMLALLTVEPVIAISSVAGFSAIYVIVTFGTKKSLKRDSLRVNQETNQVVKAIQEGLGSIRDVLINGTQATYCEIFRNSDLPLRRALANIAILSAIPRPVIEGLGTILIAVLAYSLAVSSAGIAGAIPILGALALGAQRLLPILQQAYSAWTVMQGGQASLIETLKLLDQTLPEYADTAPMAEIPFVSEINLKNISFRYEENAPLVLKQGFNMTIPKGSRVGLIGITGSGKSTVLDIVMGLLWPTSGCLEVDGEKITEKNCRGWQSRIAHVPQSIFLADTSILENIAFGIPTDEIDHARVRLAAQKAQIAKSIESWDQGYHTKVGERGVKLSGGQRQRIGIARALYKNADVIVFDEATSALDNLTESAVMEVLEGLGNELTLVIVAHRLTTLRICTQVFELRERTNCKKW